MAVVCGNGFAQSTYARYERGCSSFSVTSLKSCLDSLNVSMNEFFTFVNRAEVALSGYEGRWKASKYSIVFFEDVLISARVLPRNMPPITGRARETSLDVLKDGRRSTTQKK